MLVLYITASSMCHMLHMKLQSKRPFLKNNNMTQVGSGAEVGAGLGGGTLVGDIKEENLRDHVAPGSAGQNRPNSGKQMLGVELSA